MVSSLKKETLEVNSSSCRCNFKCNSNCNISNFSRSTANRMFCLNHHKGTKFSTSPKLKALTLNPKPSSKKLWLLKQLSIQLKWINSHSVMYTTLTIYSHPKLHITLKRVAFRRISSSNINMYSNIQEWRKLSVNGRVQLGALTVKTICWNLSMSLINRTITYNLSWTQATMPHHF